MSSNITPKRRKRIYNSSREKLIKIIMLFFFFCMLIFSPFAIINIKEKFLYLKHKTEFEKKKVEIDSLHIHNGDFHDAPTKLKIYDIYYHNKQDKLSLTDYRTIVFSLNQEKEDFKHFWQILDSHTPFYAPRNDSIWVWNHPILTDRYATENETNLDTSGFLTQIILNILILIIVLWGVTWQINEWIQLKRKK